MNVQHRQTLRYLDLDVTPVQTAAGYIAVETVAAGRTVVEFVVGHIAVTTAAVGEAGGTDDHIAVEVVVVESDRIAVGSATDCIEAAAAALRFGPAAVNLADDSIEDHIDSVAASRVDFAVAAIPSHTDYYSVKTTIAVQFVVAAQMDSDFAEMEIETAAEPSGLETAEIVLPVIVVAVQMDSAVAVIEVKSAAEIDLSLVGQIYSAAAAAVACPAPSFAHSVPSKIAEIAPPVIAVLQGTFQQVVIEFQIALGVVPHSVLLEAARGTYLDSFPAPHLHLVLWVTDFRSLGPGEGRDYYYHLHPPPHH